LCAALDQQREDNHAEQQDAEHAVSCQPSAPLEFLHANNLVYAQGRRESVPVRRLLGDGTAVGERRWAGANAAVRRSFSWQRQSPAGYSLSSVRGVYLMAALCRFEHPDQLELVREPASVASEHLACQIQSGPTTRTSYASARTADII